MHRVYIVHGYTATPDSHWFPWLEQALHSKGIACQRLVMTDSQHPQPDKWLHDLEKQATIDENTIVIGHSLGCIAWLNFLSRNFLTPKGAIFVSGFYQPLHTLPELTTFSNVYAVSPSCRSFKSYVISALDDQIVPHHYSDALAQHLQADYIRLASGGHFLDREGCTSFPLILELVMNLVK